MPALLLESELHHLDGRLLGSRKAIHELTQVLINGHWVRGFVPFLKIVILIFSHLATIQVLIKLVS